MPRIAMSAKRVAVIALVVAAALVLLRVATGDLSSVGDDDAPVIGASAGQPSSLEAVAAIAVLRVPAAKPLGQRKYPGVADAPPAGRKAVVRVDINRALSESLNQNAALYSEGFAIFNTSCGCSLECFLEADKAAAARGPIAVWGPAALKQLRDDMLAPWRKSNITLHDHVSMTACSYRTRTSWNPTGVWLHIVGRNVTVLRQMQDGYGRQRRVERHIKDVVANSTAEPLPALVVYVSTTDLPCNPMLPYLSFFLRRGVKNLVIPDDTFGGRHHFNWTAQRSKLQEAAAAHPFRTRAKKIFFRGSPTHPLRGKIRDAFQSCCANETEILLAVLEKFKDLRVPLADHAKYQHLVAIRGRTATSRDKYLNLLNATIFWAAHDDDDLTDEPWIQFYHALWRPYENYVPVRPGSAGCMLRLMLEHPEVAERVAARGAEVGAFLTQEVVDDFLIETLREYAALQAYPVPNDPIQFVSRMASFARKHYRTAQLMPDDRNPVKFMFAEWMRRRVRQMQSCRLNSTQTFSYHRQGGCWYM